MVGPGSHVISNRYVLKQTYEIRNVAGTPLQGVVLHQFLHGLHSRTAVLDDIDYGEVTTLPLPNPPPTPAPPPTVLTCGGPPCHGYRYDVTLDGTARAFVDVDRPFDDVQGEPRRATEVTDLFGLVPAIDDAFLRSLLGLDEAAIDERFRSVGVAIDPDTVADIARSEVYVVNDDYIAFHSKVPPIGAEDVTMPPRGWEVGEYGKFGIDSHVTGKPQTGGHLSVERKTLNGLAVFRTGTKWVSGTQAYALGDLNTDQTVVFDVLLSVSTMQTQTQTQTQLLPGPPVE